MIQKIRLQNIRCFKDRIFEFNKNINLIIGQNGTGKTTILEAIGFFAFGSFVSSTPDLSAVSDGQEVGRIEIFSKQKDASVAISTGKRVTKIAKKVVKNSRLVGFKKAVLFNPQTVEITNASPQIRRKEIDIAIAQKDPAFVSVLLEYRKVLKNRNSLLKMISRGQTGENVLEFWDEKLFELSQHIYESRMAFIGYTNERISPIYSKLSLRDGKSVLSYKPSCDYERYQEALVNVREYDITSGSTSIGPHRDDFSILFNTRDIKDHASRGEQRLAALALKLIQIDYLSENNHKPTLLLDDVFSELDRNRREALVSNIDFGEQVFISATDRAMIPVAFLGGSNLIDLNGGLVE
jgi:DNA replication and repair protein RecF